MQAGVGGQHVPGCCETQEMGGWKGYSKMIVSVLLAVKISTQTETTAPAGSKGKCGLHIKCLLGGCLHQHLQCPSDLTMLHCCFRYDLQRFIYIFLHLKNSVLIY